MLSGRRYRAANLTEQPVEYFSVDERDQVLAARQNQNVVVSGLDGCRRAILRRILAVHFDSSGFGAERGQRAAATLVGKLQAVGNGCSRAERAVEVPQLPGSVL